MDYQRLIDEFVAMSRKILSPALTGIYLHGSLAMGCFNPLKSDIDLIVVLERGVTEKQKRDFMEQVVALNGRAPAKGLELSLVKREHCSPFVYPTPYELHFSPAHLRWFREDPDGYIQRMNGIDRDLAAHFTVINRYGIVLYGEEIGKVFGEVPREDYMDSIWYDIENAAQDIEMDPVYVTLNLCRTLAYLKDDLCLSKAQGGRWGLQQLPRQYHEIVCAALECYESERAMECDGPALKRFAQDTLSQIRRRRDGAGEPHPIECRNGSSRETVPVTE